jgi:hypothetical protein
MRRILFLTLVVALVILSWGAVLGFAEDPQDALYQELSTSLARAEAQIAGMTLKGDATITEEQLQALMSLNLQIRGSLYSDLIDRSDLLVLLTQEQMLLHQDPQQLQARVEEMLRGSQQDERNLKRSAARDKVLRISFNTTLISFISAFSLWGLGELQDLRYFQATTIEEATLRRRLFQVFSIGSIVGATIGVVSAGVSATLYTKTR